MPTGANVQLESLENLSQGIVRFNSGLKQINADIQIVVNRYFGHFESQRAKLQNLYEHSIKRLISAENELREAMGKRRYRRDNNGDLELEPVDLTPYQNKVEACRRTKELYEGKLTECVRIIKHCETLVTFHRGIFNMITRGVERSIACISNIINDVRYYNGYRRDFSIKTAEVNTETESTEPQLPEMADKHTKLTLYDNDGRPIANRSVTIVDNTLFGFGTKYLSTNECGEVTTDLLSTDDCTIYLGDESIYEGNLFQEMEYNKYGDGRFVSSISENKTSESKDIRFAEYDDRYIKVTHTIELEPDGKDMRREERFRVDRAENTISEIEISAKSDELKSKSKDGWIKIINERSDE